MAQENKPHFIVGIAKGVFYVIVLLAVLFVALTQTQVGREGLKSELERQFDRQFEGQITIGTLSGNLVYDLYATNVSIFDPEGERIAVVDSVVAKPSWLSLMDGSFSLRSLDLYQPSFHLTRSEDLGWNIERALTPRGEPGMGETRARGVNLPRTQIINGRLLATDGRTDSPLSYVGPDPDLYALQVNSRGDISWHSEDGLRLEIASLSGDLPDLEQTIRSFSGGIVLDTAGLALRESHLQLANTDLTLSGQWNASGADPHIQATFDAETLDFDELGAFLPGIPLRNQVTASGRIEGSPSDLLFEDVYTSFGQSFIHSSGRLNVHSDDIAYNAEHFRTQLYPADAYEVLPPLGDLLAKHTGITEGIASGEVAFSRSDDDWNVRRVDIDLSATTEAGEATGLLALDFSEQPNWRYDLDLDAQSVNLGRLLPDLFPQTQITGEVLGNGTGPLESIYGRLNAELEASSVGPYAFSGVSVEAEADSGVVLGNSRLAYDMGSMVTHGQIDLRDRVDAYFLNSHLYGFDLQAFSVHDSLRTALSGSVAMRGTGFSLGDLQLNWNAQLDSSRVAWGSKETVVRPQEIDLTLASHQAGSELEIAGDALSLRLEADTGIRSIAHLGDQWIRTAGQELDRYLAEAPSDTPSEDAEAEQVDDDGRAASSFQLEVALHNSHLLTSLVPQLPVFDTDFQVTVDGLASADDIDLTGSYSGSHFHSETFRGHGLRGSLSLASSPEGQVNPRFNAEFNSQADSVRIENRLYLRNPSLQYEQSSESGLLHVTSASHEGTGPLTASADVRFRRGGSTLLMRDFSYASGEYDWQLTEAAPITFTREALRIEGLEITGHSPDVTYDQFLGLRGTLSQSPEDSLRVSASDLQIHPTTGFRLLGRPVDGLLSGQFVITGGLSRPYITGRMLVDHLSFDNRLLGQLQLQSRYQPGSPDVQVEASLRSTSEAQRMRLTPDSPELISTDNALDLSGSVRLPGTEAGDSLDPGAFDLDVDVRRAEVFIFEYIFQDLITETSGHLAGSGHIGGTFQRPVFNASLNAADGSFSIPEFNLRYNIDGAFNVDRDGIQFDDVLLSDRNDGEATVQGRLEFNEYQYFSFDLEADLDKIQIIDVRNSRVLPFYGTIAASGPAYLTGPLHNAHLRGPAVRTTPESDLFIPVTDGESHTDEGFLIFADQDGQLPDLATATQRRHVLADRPLGERTFLDGLSMDLNIDAPSGSTVHLVFDPLLGDAMSGRGSGQIQLQREEGEFRTYGTFDVTSGEYLFTAGELFFRKFQIDEGTIHWDGNPVDAQLDITASYHTRASAAGLSDAITTARRRIPLVVRMHIQDRVSQPSVDLSLAVDRSDRTLSEDYAATALETVLNQTERETEYATSVLLTNTFLLTTELEGGEEGRLTDTGNRLAFNSLSQLVGSQINRYLNEALPNVDLLLDVHGENPQDLDVIYGVALRLMDERLIIRGEGVWTDNERRSAEGMEGEFIVELRFSPTVSVEAFHRREGSLMAEQVLMSTTGAGVSYQTQFPTWKEFIYRLFGWDLPGDADEENEDSAIATRD